MQSWRPVFSPCSNILKVVALPAGHGGLRNPDSHCRLCVRRRFLDWTRGDTKFPSNDSSEQAVAEWTWPRWPWSSPPPPPPTRMVGGGPDESEWNSTRDALIEYLEAVTFFSPVRKHVTASPTSVRVLLLLPTRLP
eukprot:scaffold77477_cov51-Phaeocystis_antarctica.AAC.1